MKDLYDHKKTIYSTSDTKGSPSLRNIYGSLNALLKVVLTEGFNSTSVLGSDLDIASRVLTLTLNLNHGFRLNHVIQLSGSSQPYLEGSYRILESGGTYIKIR